MTRRLTLALVLLATAAQAQTTTTRTDRLIASTQAIIGGTTLGANTLNVTGTLGVSGASALAGPLVVAGDYAQVSKPEASSTFYVGSTATGKTYGFLQTSADASGYLTIGAVSVSGTSFGNVALVPSGGNVGIGTASVLDRVTVSGDIGTATKYSGNIGALDRKWLTIHAAELWVQTLVAADVLSTIGGRILVLPTTVLAADLGDGAGDTTITVKHNQIASGDRIYLEANGKVEFMAVTSGAGGSAGAYTYSVTRDLDTSGRNLWYAGDAVANTGAAGDGWIDLYSVRGVASGGYGPAIVGHERLSATYNDWEPRWAIGNLNGLYGYDGDDCNSGPCYGAGFGDPTANNLVIDATNGIRMRTGTTVLGQWSGSTLTLGQPLTSNNTGQMVIDSDSIDFKWRNNSGTTSTMLDIYNNGGVGWVRVTGSLEATGDVRTPTIVYASGDMTLYTTGSGNTVIVRTTGGGSLRPYADNATGLGNSSYQWSAIYGEAYYVGTTAGVDCTSAGAVTVVKGIVTGCS